MTEFEKRVRALKGFGPRTEERILTAIDQRGVSRKEYLYGDVLPVANALLERLEASDDVQRSSLAGGLRRACETHDSLRGVNIDFIARTCHLFVALSSSL